MNIMKMFTCEWDILIKLILGTAWESVPYSLQFAVDIENGENKWY